MTLEFLNSYDKIAYKELVVNCAKSDYNLNVIIIIIILFVLKVQKYTTIQAWHKQLTICDNYLKKKKK